MRRMLEGTIASFETWLKTDKGLRFPGVLMPITTDVPSGALIEPRHALRVRRAEIVKPGDVVTDGWGTRFVIGTHDQSLDANARLQRTHRAFKVTREVSWRQKTTTPDPVNPSLQRAGAAVERGPIPVAEEPIGSLERDRGTNLEFERLRIVTGYPIQLGDVVDGKQVKRLQVVFGLNVLEAS